ncbi:MAG: 16S rRNA (cytosine(967)-C(5))-methyltransferase RsmB [Pseudomonadota bacterium]
MENLSGLPAMEKDVQTRYCVFEVLESVLGKKQPFDIVFDRVLKRYPAFDGRDIGFVREMSMTALRRKGQVDAILTKLSDRPLAKIDPQTAVNLLRLGAVQLLFMDVRDHAAVDTTVKLAEAMGLGRQKGFINGILRSLGRKGEALLKAQEKDAGRLNTPEWLWKIWVQDFGPDVAAQIAEAHLEPAPVDITVKSDAEKWATDLDGQLLPNNSIRLKKSGRVTALPGYEDGVWWVQSAAAAMPAEVMGRAVKGQTVIDFCAAPGGKTMQLAALGATVTALDISKNRLKRLEENLERCHLEADIVIADGKKWQPEAPVDVVLIDAPCTATGTIRHQPDVLHLKAPDDMRRMVETQKAILENAAKAVKPGGMLVYCTCSLQKAESEDVIQSFLNNNSAFKTSPVSQDELPWLENALTDEGWLRVLPFHLKEYGGMDGFFIARLIRG